MITASNNSATSDNATWQISPLQWGALLAAVAAAIAAFQQGLTFMVATWGQVEEFSYGYLVPVISAFLIWQRSDELRRAEFKGSWSGLWIVAAALLLGAIGDLSAIRLFSQYGFVVALFGISICLLGGRGTRVVAMPLALLLLMIPLPQFLLRELSQQLQLLSSQIGVELIRAFGISVFLEGNVIDLGSYKLQVAEACSGLRYLFPLIVLGVLAAYFFKGAGWKRLLIVASTVPLTILVNSLRIGLIGITVEHWGSDMADGLLHDFEGWFMFMVSFAALVGEMSVLARLGSGKTTLRAAFALDFPAPVAPGAKLLRRHDSKPLMTSAFVLVATALVVAVLPAREQLRPQRSSFEMFPMTLNGGWVGRRASLAKDVVDILAVDDHLIANYERADGPPINFYAAYYDTQSGGQSTHSPRTCIPGGGWEITDFDEVALAVGETRHVNRVVIRKGEQRQLVYYWFQQRGRVLTDELAVKWFILYDGMTRSRSDGALVRLVTPISAVERIGSADQRLQAFLASAQQKLPAFVPD